MAIFKTSKDGGPESPVIAYFLIEWKGLFSVAILKFNKGGREAFHTHAFNSLTWFIKGSLIEVDVSGARLRYKRSLKPKLTTRSKNHRVVALKDSWCLTLRGPWVENWTEYNRKINVTTTFSHGRRIIDEVNRIV